MSLAKCHWNKQTKSNSSMYRVAFWVTRCRSRQMRILNWHCCWWPWQATLENSKSVTLYLNPSFYSFAFELVCRYFQQSCKFWGSVVQFCNWMIAALESNPRERTSAKAARFASAKGNCSIIVWPLCDGGQKHSAVHCCYAVDTKRVRFQPSFVVRFTIVNEGITA